jgi:4-amino-4-deoxy-L-arabinose transferase-like glycosyltransferase
MTATIAPGRHRPVRAAGASRPVRGGPRRLLLGPAGQPAYARPALLALLAGTAVLYLSNLGASGYANSFYAAAVQAGTQSWKALLFGSLDAGNVITVDKPPAALWVMALSGRIFGFSSWSMLAPQALEGVAAVALLYAAVRRWSGPAAGLAAGAALALTPVAALMFRFNNPDALLTLLLVVGAYCVVRASERASGWWLALAGAAVGFGFLTKMLQAFLVLPAFALVYLLAAPTSPGRRVLHVLGAGLAVLASAGWYVAVADLWPASSRPYIGGSTNNSVLQLALGYNGLGRIFGGAGNGGGGGGSAGGNGGGFGGGGFGANTAFGGSTGVGRLFGASMGTEISWLLPAALVGLVAGLWFTRRAPRTDRTRAALLLWGGWLLVTGAVFSYMAGTTHPYYTVALAPPIGALVAIAGRELWRGRASAAARSVLAAMVAVTGVWDFILLDRTPSWLPALRWAVLVASVLVAAVLAVGAQQAGRLAAALLAAAVLTVAAGTAAYAVDTAATPHSGSIPTSGPFTGNGFGGPGNGSGGPGGRGGPGGFGTESASGQLVAALRSTTTTWAAASMGAQGAASLQLASGRPVMAIGGFTGSDPAPTLAQFQRYVADGRIHYFVTGGMGGGPGGRGGDEISSWVRSHFASTTIGGQTVYDLTQPRS